jgi:hypothetical protein
MLDQEYTTTLRKFIKFGNQDGSNELFELIGGIWIENEKVDQDKMIDVLGEFEPNRFVIQPIKTLGKSTYFSLYEKIDTVEPLSSVDVPVSEVTDSIYESELEQPAAPTTTTSDDTDIRGGN